MSTITRAAITGNSVKDGFVLEAPVLDEELQVEDDADHGDASGGGDDADGSGGGGAQRMQRHITEACFHLGLMALTTGLRVQ